MIGNYTDHDWGWLWEFLLIDSANFCIGSKRKTIRSILDIPCKIHKFLFFDVYSSCLIFVSLQTMVKVKVDRIITMPVPHPPPPPPPSQHSSTFFVCRACLQITVICETNWNSVVTELEERVASQLPFPLEGQAG